MKITFADYMLRDWYSEDAPILVKYANNKEIQKNLRDSFPYPYTRSDADEFLAKITSCVPRTIFAIATAEEAIGSIGLMLGKDVHRYTAEMGFWLAEPFWNNGIMSEAVKFFTEFAFENFQLNRIFAEPYINNRGSAKVLEKAGYVLEGTLRANVCKDGEILDQFIYSQVRRSWT